MIISLNVKRKNYFNAFVFLVLFFTVSCDPRTRLLLRPTGPEATVPKHELLNIEFLTRAGHGWFTPEKIGQVGVNIQLTGKVDFKFDGAKTYIIDNTGKKILPNHKSVFRKGSFYEKDKGHDIGLVFSTYYEDSEYILLPVELHLPTIYFMDKNDSLHFSVMKIQVR